MNVKIVLMEQQTLMVMMQVVLIQHVLQLRVMLMNMFQVMYVKHVLLEQQTLRVMMQVVMIQPVMILNAHNRV